MSATITLLGVNYTVPSNSLDTNYAAGDLAFKQACAAAIVNTQGTFVDVTLQNGFTFGASGHLQYRKSVEGVVYLRGHCRKVGGGSTGVTLATLPSGYRPPGTTYFPITGGIYTSPAAAIATIDSSGLIKVYSGDTDGVCFDLVFFSV